CRLARLADHVEEGAAWIELLEQRPEGLGVDRVGDDDVETGGLPGERRTDGARAEGRPPDTEDDQRVELPPRRGGDFDHAPDVIAAVRQVGELETARRPSCGELG